MNDPSCPKVFISYSHETQEHDDKVLKLAAQLREQGIDAWIDLYTPHPSEGWPRWMTKQIEEADFILLVCTEIYHRRFEGREESGKGRGATWEGLLANQVLYDSGTINDKCIPVQFERNEEAIPISLRAYKHYILFRDFELLYRHLTNQPEIVIPPIGAKKTLSPINAARQALPQLQAAVSSVPAPMPELSPFFPGPAVVRREDFFGRNRERIEVEDALHKGQPVQILGETRMGKTSMLNRIEEDLAPKDRPVVRIDAQNVAGASPASLVVRIAQKLGQETYFDEHTEIDAGSAHEICVLSAIRDLAPFTLILDEADRLADPGHKFTPNFLSQCRSLCQDNGIVWISASRIDLQVAFQQTGLTSDFLNDSKRIWIGHLEQNAAEKMLAMLGQEASVKIIEQTGGFAYGLQWLGDSWWRRASDGAQSLTDSYAIDMAPTFSRWWYHRSDKEKSLLRKALSRISVSNLSDGERRALRLLKQQGLAVEDKGAFYIPGAAWQDYVRDVN